jgi:uncharacterized membrane protein
VSSLAGCSFETESPVEVTDVTEGQSALLSSCATDSDCASGFVCWASGNGCVRASSCYSGSTGPGVFVGSLTVDATDTAADLQSLGNAWCVTGDISVKKTSLADLSGLRGIITVAGNVDIEDNPALVSLEGLNGLRRTSKVSLFRNASLASLSALSRLDTLMSLQVYVNPALSNLSGLQSVASLSWAEVVNNAGLTSLAGLDSVASAYSYIDVRQNPLLMNLSGLGSLASVGNLVQITDNPQLQSLQGLGKLTTIGSTLRVMRNGELDDLKGLAKLKSTGTFQVSDNPQLDSCNVAALATSVLANCSGCLRNGPCPPPDNCPDDPAKLEPGVCGCGVADLDSDGDGVADCHDACAGHDDHVDVDQNGIPDGCQECVTAENCDDGNPGTTESCVDTHCVSAPTDFCPNDPAKLEPGVCGCGVADVDTDADGIADCQDACAGSDDHIDVDQNGIPDGCQQCVTAATCDDGNPCTTDACVATACSNTPNTGSSCGDQGKCSAAGTCVEPLCKFKFLGPLTDPSNRAVAVSSDGRTIAGTTTTATGSQAFRWTQELGKVPLFPSYSLVATAISGDGRFIAGYTTSSTNQQAFFEGPSSPVFNQPQSFVKSMSADGRFIVGQSTNRAYRWDAFFGHPTSVNLAIFSVANDISADGLVIVGQGKPGGDLRGLQAIVYQASTATTTGLGDFANSASSVSSEATAVSPNGRIVVGTASDGFTDQAFRWTRETGMVKLTPYIDACAVTDNGMILGSYSVLGSSIGDGDLKALLTACGVEFGANSSVWAGDMTPDGKTIVGWVSYGPDSHAFSVQLP